MKTSVSISVVFTDLVGSTELSSRLGPVATEELRSVHFGLLREAVESTDGTEVKNLGDGLMVVYSSLRGALDGAVAMQQSVDRYNRRADVPLGVRVGVSTGDAIFDDDEADYFGEPVVEAARLCAKADGGQIVTTEMVRILARRTDHEFASLGALDLKGLPEPVEASELAWAPLRDETQVRLPSRLTMLPPSGIVGRTDELDQIGAAAKVAFTGGGHRVVLLSGDAGVGKTTLVSAVARSAHDDGATVVYGRCDDELRVPYQPFVEALGAFVTHAPDEVLRAVGDRELASLARLLPVIEGRVSGLAVEPSSDADAERYLLFGAVVDLLTAAATHAPVLVVMDDLHWADKSTVQLLRHLVSTLGPAEVLILGTYRDSDITADHPLAHGLAALRREESVERVRLVGLDDQDVIVLVESIAGHALDGDSIDVAHAVGRETGGNPFFTTEVFRHLVETGSIRQEAGRWVSTVDLAAIGLPESVREVVGRRVRRLGEPVQEVLAVASVIGREFDLSTVARIAERDEDDVLDALEEAMSSTVVSEVAGRPDRFTFTHALLQHTLYDDLAASRRSRLHRRVAESLEADVGDEPGDRIGELAHHWIAATRPADTDKAIDSALRAGHWALESLAPDEAIRWFRQALDLADVSGPDTASTRLDALVGLGIAQRQAGDPEYRATLLGVAEAAFASDDRDRLVAATLANQRGMVSNIGSVDGQRISMLERALTAVGPDDRSIRARFLAMLTAELTFSQDVERIRSTATEAESVARRIGDSETLLSVLNVMFLPRWLPDDHAGTVDRATEALALAESHGDLVDRFQATSNYAQMMASQPDRAGLEAAVARALDLARETRQPHMIWQAMSFRCLVALLAGDADEADRLASEALQISSDSGQPDAFVVYGANLINIRLHQGRLDEVLPFIEQAAADNPGLPSFAAAHALALCECGRLAEAQPLLEAALALDFDNEAYDYVWLTTTTVWADVAARLGDGAACSVLSERLTPFESLGVCSGASFSGTVGAFLARLAAVLGRRDEALAMFDRTDRQLSDLGAPFWRARNQIEWAEVLASGSGDDRDRARQLLAEATTTSGAHGCDGLGRRAAEVAQALG